MVAEIIIYIRGDVERKGCCSFTGTSHCDCIFACNKNICDMKSIVIGNVKNQLFTYWLIEHSFDCDNNVLNWENCTCKLLLYLYELSVMFEYIVCYTPVNKVCEGI